MGSLNADGIPVVSKTSDTFRNRDGTMIYKTNSVTDVKSNEAASSEERAIGSGSMISGGTCTYVEEKVWGVTMGGRTTSARVASKVGNTRDLDVELGDNQTIAVIPTGLGGNVPQLDVRHTGNRVVTHQSIGDVLVERASDTGVYGV
jgi:hypothetical protein